MRTNSFAPEPDLRGLNRRLQQLLSTSVVLKQHSGNDELEKELLGHYRKISLSGLFEDKYVIALSGLQGVGKTTLLKQLYDIPDSILPEDVGRGEKLPVLVTEHPIEDFKLFVRRAVLEEQGHYKLVDVEVNSGEEFFRISTSPSEQDLWLELHVPNRYFYTADRSIALLPGLEDFDDEEDSLWQDFVRYTLTMASTCVVALNKIKLAQGDNQALVRTIVDEFGAAKPIVALTFSDKYVEEDNLEIKQSVMSLFQIPPEEEERVVLTGVGSYTERWMKPLIHAISKYAVVRREFRRNQMNHLHHVLSELTLTLGKVNTELALYDAAAEQLEDQDYRKSLRVFDRMSSALRKEVEKQLVLQLSTHEAQVKTEIEDYIISKNWKNRLKQFFLGSSYSEHVNFMREIQEIWQKPRSLNGSKDLYLGFHCSNAMNQVVMNRLGQFSQKQDRLIFVPGEQQVQASNTSQGLVVKPELIQNLNQYFRDTDDGQKNVEVLEEDSIRLIPIIALERVSQSMVLPHLPYEESNGAYKMGCLNESVMGQLKAVSFAPGSIVNGIALVFGLDAIDGTINTIPALLQTMGIQATTTAVSIGMSLCGLVSLAFVAGNVARQITKQDFADDELAHTVIKQFNEQYRSMVIELYDNCVQEARDRLERQIRTHLYKQNEFVRWEKLRHALRDVQNNVYEVQAGIHGRIGFLG